MRDTIGLMIVAVALIGCSTTSRRNAFTADGQPAYAISCKRDMSGCHGLAGRTCKDAGYKVISEDSPDPAKTKNLYHGMIIQCKS